MGGTKYGLLTFPLIKLKTYANKKCVGYWMLIVYITGAIEAAKILISQKSQKNGR